MKTKKKIILTVLLIFCISLLIGAVYLFGSIFPKAEELSVPEAENITSVSVSTDEDVTAEDVNTEDILPHIRNATPTRRQSVNDYPTVIPYYKVVVEDSERVYHYFVYQEDNTVYIELPYEGIYKADTELLNSISEYF